MRIITYLIFLTVLTVGVTFAYLNATPVSFNYYLNTKIMPLSLLMTISFGVGIMLGFLANTATWLRLKSQNYRFKRRLQNLEQNLIKTEK
jgi:lipopolysaccharide assembly protein A